MCGFAHFLFHAMLSEFFFYPFTHVIRLHTFKLECNLAELKTIKNRTKWDFIFASKTKGKKKKKTIAKT